MPKPLNEFGGWLTFFNVSLWINVVSIILMSIILLLSFLKITDSTAVFVNVITLMRYLIAGFLMFQMIALVKKQETITPGKIVQVIMWYAVVYIVFVFLIWVLSFVDGNALLERSRIVFLIGGFPIIAWSLIWWQYFKTSKRVMAYYGQNAGT